MGPVSGPCRLWPRLRAALTALTALLLSAAACPAQTTTSNAPYVFFIVIDTVRADHCSFAGYQRQTTPNLDSLAQDSTVFLNAQSPSSWTLPSYSSMLSGKQAYNLDLSPGHQNRMLTDTVAVPFNEAGYTSVSIQTNFFLHYLDSEFSERYWYMSPYTNPANKDADGRAIDKALSWLDADQGGENFMFIGLIGPHATYYPHSEYFNRYYQDGLYRSSPFQSVTTKMEPHYRLTKDSFDGEAKVQDPTMPYYDDARVYQASYDSELAYTDEQLGRLISYLKSNGLYDDSLIIVTSDHGETMSEGSEYFTHGDNLYQRETNVPLLIKLPHQYESNTVTQWVSTLDIFPTVFEYLGMSSQGQEGSSLLPLIYGQDNGRDKSVVSYVVSPQATQYSIIHDGLKLIKYVRDGQPTTYELFNLADDPNERLDISCQYPELVRRLDERLSAQVSKQ